MESREIITYKPLILKVMNIEEASTAYADKNLMQLMSFLHTPLTIEDLGNAFKKANNEKSGKTIYRYLKRLVKAGLIVPAGKRIYIDEEGQIRTQTVYSRVARVVTVATSSQLSKEEKEPWEKGISIILLEKFGLMGKFGSASDVPIKEIMGLVNSIIWRRFRVLEETLKKSANEELTNLLDDMKLPSMFCLADLVSWILVLSEQIDLEKEIEECLQKARKD